ncbi:MAG TPA: hypothetical protein VFN13_13625 [Rudaea sp.]|nr:hypothetical protein [Rudaea sp.]
MLTAVVPDRSALDDTYQDRAGCANETVRELEENGQMVEAIHIDVGTLCAWCNEQVRPVEGGARAKYVCDLLHQSHRFESPHDGTGQDHSTRVPVRPRLGLAHHNQQVTRFAYTSSNAVAIHDKVVTLAICCLLLFTPPVVPRVLMPIVK